MLSEGIDVRDISFAYRQQEKIINELTCFIKQGMFFAIAGPNGAGKSTFLNLLFGALRPISGSIKLNGREVSSYKSKDFARLIAVVRQQFVPAFGFSVYETVMMARTPFFNVLGFEGENDKYLVNHALELTETAHLKDRELDQISGGERQRVFIARAIAQDTPILVLDEPTSSLDLKHQVAIYDLLKKMQIEQGKTVIIVTHNINLAAQYCDMAMLLSSGSFHIESPEDIYKKNLISTVFGIDGTSLEVEGRRVFIPRGNYTNPVR
ncbi:Iron(3+)-hydroxamate import ATP-binding protein FhuC [Limihaloglobus sulfuriphilus]|uniref:Iron(3+)-hydroxamate import ATP-binding protein FhuC n=1 Tax=Limihaloglobus sulfuriphilus TaxID=1851148 RepID=A0A1Q2MDZ5_9BACT|nr:ABC transporter ATP-binding protein [Limihaloglobus sulfuriphilus]AQQ70890.1 Iron(3+)-hydroxamate import ATP-binding protein FhuC [Limihaloglobus sulfuriphilus]